MLLSHRLGKKLPHLYLIGVYLTEVCICQRSIPNRGVYLIEVCMPKVVYVPDRGVFV
jgi:hypothetical protein